MNAMTAAHRTLPFDTWVRVERRDNGKSVRVRINDRGPFIKGRVIDLSREAAKHLEILEKGVMRVRLTVIRRPPAKRSQSLTKNHFKKGNGSPVHGELLIPPISMDSSFREAQGRLAFYGLH
jgi:rare lipoprotein A